MKPQTRVIIGWKNLIRGEKKFVKEVDDDIMVSTNDVFEANDFENLTEARAVLKEHPERELFNIYDLTLTPTLRRVPDDES